MDYEERVVKLEVNMDTLKEGMTLLRDQIAALDRKVEEFREQSIRRTDELREQTTRQIADSRVHSDQQFNEIRAELIHMRRAHERLIYWVAGLTFTNLVTIIGLVLKVTGVL